MSELRAVYQDQLKQLRRMSDRIERTIAELVEMVSDDEISERLKKTKDRFQRHSERLESLLSQIGDERERDAGRSLATCASHRNMRPRGVADDDAIVTQGRQLCRGGLGAFAFGKAIAESLEDPDAARKLGGVLVDIHELDGLIGGMTTEMSRTATTG